MEKNNTESQTKSGNSKSSAWEKAATEIAGDNQLLGSMLKLLLSPFTLLAGLGIIIYLFINSNNLKKEVEKLKEENKKLTEENEELTDESERNYNKYRKLKQFLDAEQKQAEKVSLNQVPVSSESKPKLKTTYLR